MNNETRDKKVTDIWYCEICSAAHVPCGETVLTFDREEFDMFTERVVDVNVRGWADHYSAQPLSIRDTEIKVVEISSENVIH